MFAIGWFLETVDCVAEGDRFFLASAIFFAKSLSLGLLDCPTGALVGGVLVLLSRQLSHPFFCYAQPLHFWQKDSSVCFYPDCDLVD